MCPKVFSTSPGTLVYSLDGGPYAGNPAGFEAAACGGGVHKGGASGEPIAYKMSVNTRESSATFANSSLIYYHFARYFHATVHVPVAVLRSIDRKEHSRRVSSRGAALSAGRSNLKMNHAAWQALLAAERDPSTYRPAAELFTPEGLLYGVMLHPSGKRYSEEINGTRKSGWGDGQNRDFQETAPFRALRSEKPLAEAIEEGRRVAFQDPKLAKATGKRRHARADGVLDERPRGHHPARLHLQPAGPYREHRLPALLGLGRGRDAPLAAGHGDDATGRHRGPQAGRWSSAPSSATTTPACA